METGNELDKACFQHDMVYLDFKDLTRRTASDRLLRDKAFNSAKNLKFDGHRGGLASTVYKFFEKSPLHLQIYLLKVVVLLCCKICN